ncbi:MAG: recombinase RecT [Clostridiales bacterium]|nr:recombinase RecT [Clostridiales bacterium]
MAGKIQTAAQNNAVQNNNTKILQEYLRGCKKAFANALPKMITPERFTRMAMTALTTNSKLGNCTPQSFIGACLYAAQLGLEPNTPLGQAYLIPYGKQCQFQLGYKGLIELAYRSDQFKNITAQVVYENDTFDYEYGLEPVLKHKPAKTNRGNIEYVYAVYNLKNGGFAFEVMSIDDVKTFARKYSKSYNSGPWQTDFEAMAKKTVLKRLLKYAPLSTEVAQAASYDSMKIEADLSGADNEMELDLTPALIVDDETGEVTEAASAIEKKSAQVSIDE